MQIPATKKDAEESARDACDTYACKIPVEIVQMCTTALRSVHGCVITGKVDCSAWGKGMRDPYKSFSQHHPIVWWVAGARAHFRWALKYGLALTQQYELRFNRKHMCGAFLMHLQRWVDKQGFPASMPESVTPAQWLQFVKTNFPTQTEAKHAEWAKRIATKQPPNGCQFGIVAIKDFEPSTPDNWVQSYREYIKHKEIQWRTREVRPLKMTWSGAAKRPKESSDDTKRAKRAKPTKATKSAKRAKKDATQWAAAMEVFYLTIRTLPPGGEARRPLVE